MMLVLQRVAEQISCLYHPVLRSYPPQAKSILGDHLTNVGLNRDNVSEVLQQFMEAHCAQTEMADMTLSLKTKAFQAHTPSQKASVLAFLVNELACSKSVVRYRYTLGTTCLVWQHFFKYSSRHQSVYRVRRELWVWGYSLLMYTVVLMLQSDSVVHSACLCVCT